VPDFFAKLPNQDSDEFKKFQTQYLRIKRNLEIQMLKENRRHEAVQDVLSLISPGKNREVQKSKFKKIQKLANKMIEKQKQEEREQAEMEKREEE